MRELVNKKCLKTKNLKQMLQIDMFYHSRHMMDANFEGQGLMYNSSIISGHSEGLEQKLVKYMSLAHDKRV